MLQNSLLLILTICWHMQLETFQRVLFNCLGRVMSGLAFSTPTTILWMRWYLSLNQNSRFQNFCMTDLLLGLIYNLDILAVRWQTNPFSRWQFPEGKDQLWTEKRESELQRSLKKWFAIVGNWPDSWRCKQELTACATIDESMGLLGDYLSGKAPATLVKRANSMVFLHNKLHDLGYFWPI